MINKYKVPLLSFFSFVLIGIVAYFYRDVRYLSLFVGIGFIEFIVRSLIIHYPHLRQIFRLLVQAVVGGFLLFYLSIVIGVNFQFPQIVFDAVEGIVTGALIQTLVARIALPLILGNAFCSRACWTGLFFEVTNHKKCKKPYARNKYIAWAYLVVVCIIAIVITQNFTNPAADEELRKAFIIGENIFIITIGFVFTFFLGSRSYCRLLCPFLTISGLLSPLSLFKVTPINSDDCTNCKRCNDVCPMLIDVNKYVIENKRINHRQCILCERCISSCNENVIRVDSKRYTNKK